MLSTKKKMATNWTIDGVQEALAAKKISARELAADFYKRIEAKNPELNAYLTFRRSGRAGKRTASMRWWRRGSRCRRWRVCRWRLRM